MAWPNRSSFFPVGALLPATFKTYLTDFYDQTVALLGSAGTASGARAALGVTCLIGRNRIINGNFAINQRGVSGTVTLAGGQYGHDRWKAGGSGCTYTFTTSGLDTIITITSGTLMQVIEDKNIEGGTYRLSHAGTAQARVTVNGAASTGAYAAAPFTTAAATANQAVTVEFSTGTVSKVMLEPGILETAFERRSCGFELRECQRYYQVVHGNIQFYAPQAATFSVPMPYLCQMRAAPTATASGGAPVNITSDLLEGITAASARFTVTSAAAGQAVFADRLYLLTAEL